MIKLCENKLVSEKQSDSKGDSPAQPISFYIDENGKKLLHAISKFETAKQGHRVSVSDILNGCFRYWLKPYLAERDFEEKARLEKEGKFTEADEVDKK